MGSARRRAGGFDSSEARTNEFPRKSVLIEKPKGSARKTERLRMMLLRDETEGLLRFLRRSGANQEFAATLLYDEMAGIGPLAANLFRIAASRRMDIGPAVPALSVALSDKYAKTEAASALAMHYLNVGNDEAFNILLFSDDQAIARTAQLVAMKEATDAKKG